MSGKRRKYTPEFREQAARLVIETGRPVARVAAEIGIGEQVLGRWVRLQRLALSAGDTGAVLDAEGHDGLDISKGTWGDTGAQYTWLTTNGVGTEVGDADLKPGDLIYFGDSGAGSHHVAVYAGNGLMIQAAQSGVPVEVSPMAQEKHFNVHINN
jgi:hypothetical protein